MGQEKNWANKKDKTKFVLKTKEKEIKDRIIRDIWTLFKTEKERNYKKIKEIGDRIINDKIIRYIGTLFW